MMSRWPRVTGSYDPGQTAIPPLRSDATVDGYAGVAVGALVDERKRQGQRGALVGFGHGERGLCQERGQELGQRLPHLGGGTIWRVRENEVEGGLGVGSPEVRGRVPDPDDRVWVADRMEVRPDGVRGMAAAVDEHGLGRAARQRLDPERPRAGVEVEDPCAR